MSTIELQQDLGDLLDAFDLAKDQKRCKSGRHSKNSLLLQKLSNRAVVLKTLHDPADTLSKREKKRLQKASSSSSLDLDVQYSLNKQQRWKTINVQSLLDSQSEFEPEALVVNGVITPSYLNDHQSLKVKDMFAKDGDVITKISSKGKGHKLRHFEMALRERREIDKDKVQPARILYNVVAPNPASTVPTRKTRNNTRGARTTKYFPLDYSSAGAGNESDSEVEEASISTSAPSSSFTLGDFVVGASATSKTQRCARRITLLVQDEERKKKISGIKSPPHSISSYYSSSSLFEVIDMNEKLLGGMEFHDAIASLEHERLTIKWVDSGRVMIDASRLVKNSPDEPVRQPLLILFFELRENDQHLRVRINTNIRYKAPMDSEALIFMVKRQRDFVSLFNSIIDFIRGLRERNLVIPMEETRFTKSPKDFHDDVNSRKLAVEQTTRNLVQLKPIRKNEHERETAEHKRRIQRCDDYEILRYLREAYVAETSLSLDLPKSSSSTCCRCTVQKKDLFKTRDGVICRECVASGIVRQLAYDQFPVEIPVSPTPRCTSIDLLFAVLPLSILSKVTEASYQHLRSDQMVFSTCPSCDLNVMFENDGNNDENKSLICPVCSSHWCRLCSSEPHWPMKCEEFRQWSEKWEQQYFVDKFHLQPDEELLRISCWCGSVLFLPSGTAHNKLCPGCLCRYDKTGMMCDDYLHWPYYPRLRKRRDLEGKPKEGYKVDVETMPRVKLIAKEFANICTEARNQRFDKDKQVKFEESALAAERPELVDLRKTALILAENCTAWLYIHRAEIHLHKDRSAVSHLLQQYNKVQFDLERKSLTIAKEIDELNSAVKNVIRTLSERLSSTDEEE